MQMYRCDGCGTACDGDPELTVDGKTTAGRDVWHACSWRCVRVLASRHSLPDDLEDARRTPARYPNWLRDREWSAPEQQPPKPPPEESGEWRTDEQREQIREDARRWAAQRNWLRYRAGGNEQQTDEMYQEAQVRDAWPPGEYGTPPYEMIDTTEPSTYSVSSQPKPPPEESGEQPESRDEDPEIPTYVCLKLAEVLEPSAHARWWTTPNDKLGGDTPQEAWETRAHMVIQVIEGYESAAYS